MACAKTRIWSTCLLIAPGRSRATRKASPGWPRPVTMERPIVRTWTQSLRRTAWLWMNPAASPKLLPWAARNLTKGVARIGAARTRRTAPRRYRTFPRWCGTIPASASGWPRAAVEPAWCFRNRFGKPGPAFQTTAFAMFRIFRLLRRRITMVMSSTPAARRRSTAVRPWRRPPWPGSLRCSISIWSRAARRNKLG